MVPTFVDTADNREALKLARDLITHGEALQDRIGGLGSPEGVGPRKGIRRTHVDHASQPPARPARCAASGRDHRSGHGLGGAVTELDLGLKVGVRQLFWSMGLSTRLDVESRGFSPPPKAGARPRAAQTFTDLDVLGVSINNGFRVGTEIADCKTSQRDSTSRMFWVRGVADLFGADHAYLVREHDVTDAARQLSARLGVAVLPSEDLVRLQAHYPSPAAVAESPMGVLFDLKGRRRTPRRLQRARPPTEEPPGMPSSLTLGLRATPQPGPDGRPPRRGSGASLTHATRFTWRSSST